MSLLRPDTNAKYIFFIGLLGLPWLWMVNVMYHWRAVYGKVPSCCGIGSEGVNGNENEAANHNNETESSSADAGTGTGTGLLAMMADEGRNGNADGENNRKWFYIVTACVLCMCIVYVYWFDLWLLFFCHVFHTQQVSSTGCCYCNEYLLKHELIGCLTFVHDFFPRPLSYPSSIHFIQTQSKILHHLRKSFKWNYQNGSNDQQSDHSYTQQHSYHGYLYFNSIRITLVQSGLSWHKMRKSKLVGSVV